jgi:hypothetical protein
MKESSVKYTTHVRTAVVYDIKGGGDCQETNEAILEHELEIDKMEQSGWVIRSDFFNDTPMPNNSGKAYFSRLTIMTLEA